MEVLKEYCGDVVEPSSAIKAWDPRVWKIEPKRSLICQVHLHFLGLWATPDLAPPMLIPTSLPRRTP
jgi:hypothetical protein